MDGLEGGGEVGAGGGMKGQGRGRQLWKVMAEVEDDTQEIQVINRSVINQIVICFLSLLFAFFTGEAASGLAMAKGHGSARFIRITRYPGWTKGVRLMGNVSIIACSHNTAIETGLSRWTC